MRIRAQGRVVDLDGGWIESSGGCGPNLGHLNWSLSSTIRRALSAEAGPPEAAAAAARAASSVLGGAEPKVAAAAARAPLRAWLGVDPTRKRPRLQPERPFRAWPGVDPTRKSHR